MGSTAEVVAVLYRGAFREREMVVLLCGLPREAIGKGIGDGVRAESRYNFGYIVIAYFDMIKLVWRERVLEFEFL